MELVFAKNGGFCRGVKKAVDTALSVSPENTYIFGEIIHNPKVVEEITARGIVTVDKLSDVPQGATLIIRSHGVGKSVYEECARRDIKVVDCTCEFVKRTQKIIKAQYEAGKAIIIVGERTHPEVIGLNGWCDNSAYIFSSETDDFSILPPKKCCVVAQTTYSKEKFEKIIKNLNDKSEKTVEVFETICYTTIGRQNEASELAQKCDAIIVIGGLNSSNTNKLYDVCAKYCKNVFRLENAADLEYTTIKSFKKVGIVTGASTPNSQTQEVLLKMEMETEAKATMMEEVVANMDNQTRFKKGQLITATISSADDTGVAVLLPNTKKEVMLDKAEVDCEVYNKDEFNAKTGEEIELMVVAVTPRVVLSQKQIKQVKEEEAMLAEIQSGKEFEVTCTGFNKGGLTSTLGSYTVFVPAREVRSGFVKELDKYVGKKLRLRMLEVRKERRKEIIASQRVIIEEERAAKEAARAAKEAEFFANIHVDDVVEGKVERITAFGAFVSVNGFDCLAHISDLSWTGVKSVADVLETGKKYEFKVLKIDEESKKVSIGYKQLQPQPWDLVAEKYVEGDVIHGKVVRIVPFGAFVEVEKGIDGLVHVSQISHEFLENPTTVLAIGQEIDAKILKLDCENRKMTLSIKALEPKPEVERKPKEEGEGKTRSRKAKDVKPDDEVTEWSESSDASISIADLLNQK
ncbi:MAG: bifunctional 4-hydroxy-3-methylbut-2-enyl diphosphate reductase/30S ribosomal protein S1 [Clostridiales bacterium]|nr:bifunctional 4-hydroxy-3-methylbut-2-enyl diphosphate reductase/30S ribosomal protein S1 [Clostridiales bacterium]